MLAITPDVYAAMVAHCLDALPDEGCGLLAGVPGSDRITVCYPTGNVAASARLYTVDPHDHLRADRDAEGRGLEILGAFHSHTHTEAWPSPTDVAQAPDPAWWYVIVSLRDVAPVTRAFRIVDGAVVEEPIVVDGR